MRTHHQHQEAYEARTLAAKERQDDADEAFSDAVDAECEDIWGDDGALLNYAQEALAGFDDPEILAALRADDFIGLGAIVAGLITEHIAQEAARRVRLAQEVADDND